MKKLKAVTQQDFKDCGVCCMQWIFIYYGGYISLEKLREETLTDNNGTNAFQIVSTFKKWGFDSLGIKEDNIESLTNKMPLIAHVVLANGLEHFVVVIDIEDNIIHLMDPGYGYKKMSITEFKEIFSGNVIIAIPINKIINYNNDLTISKLFLQIIKKEKFLIIKIIITSIIWTIITIICGYYLKISNSFINQDQNILKFIIIAFGILTIIKTFTLFIREYYENHLANLVDVYLYPPFFFHLFHLPLKNIKSRSPGEIITRVSEISNIKALFSEIFVNCFLDSIMMVISMVILCLLNNELFLILLVFVIIYSIYGFFTSKIIYNNILNNITHNTNFNAQVIENIGMIESGKNLNVIDKLLTKIEKSLSQYLLSNYEITNNFNVINYGKNFLIEGAIFLINSYGIWNTLKGNITLIDLFTFNLILGYCIDPVKNIIDLLPKYNYIKASFMKITEFMNIDEEKIDKQNFNLKGDIVFENVIYSYNNYDNILNNLNLTIKDGEHILLNGKSGSGKSTICKLLYKENICNHGCIKIGNINIDDLSNNVIRSNILYVSQNEELFTGTIRENILMERNIPLDKFNAICDICKLEDIVSKKRLRYDSLIEGGVNNLSGGEKQRIILARGLLKDANIIILDEALSEVDKELEEEIIQKIKKYFKDKTIIYISHKNQTNNFKKVIEIGG